MARDNAGECTAPRRKEFVGKYDPASLCTNITQVNIINTDTGGYQSSSELVVWGAED